MYLQCVQRAGADSILPCATLSVYRLLRRYRLLVYSLVTFAAPFVACLILALVRLQLPAGVIEGGETTEDVAKRELLEETGRSQ